jgi:hypothetical protein
MHWCAARRASRGACRSMRASPTSISCARLARAARRCSACGRRPTEFWRSASKLAATPVAAAATPPTPRRYFCGLTAVHFGGACADARHWHCAGGLSRGFVMASFVAPPLAIDDAVLLITDWRCIHWRGRCYVEVAPRGFVMLLAGGCGGGVGHSAAACSPARRRRWRLWRRWATRANLVPVAQRALAVAEKASKGAIMRRFAVRARVRAVSPAMQAAPHDQSSAHFLYTLWRPTAPAPACCSWAIARC